MLGGARTEGWSGIAAEQGGRDIWINPPAVSKQSYQHRAGHREVVLVEHVDDVTDSDGHRTRVRVVGDHVHAISLTVEAQPAPPSSGLLWIAVEAAQASTTGLLM